MRATRTVQWLWRDGQLLTVAVSGPFGRSLPYELLHGSRNHIPAVCGSRMFWHQRGARR